MAGEIIQKANACVVKTRPYFSHSYPDRETAEAVVRWLDLCEERIKKALEDGSFEMVFGTDSPNWMHRLCLEVTGELGYYELLTPEFKRMLLPWTPEAAIKIYRELPAHHEHAQREEDKQNWGYRIVDKILEAEGPAGQNRKNYKGLTSYMLAVWMKAPVFMEFLNTHTPEETERFARSRAKEVEARVAREAKQAEEERRNREINERAKEAHAKQAERDKMILTPEIPEAQWIPEKYWGMKLELAKSAWESDQRTARQREQERQSVMREVVRGFKTTIRDEILKRVKTKSRAYVAWLATEEGGVKGAQNLLILKEFEQQLTDVTEHYRALRQKIWLGVDIMSAEATEEAHKLDKGLRELELEVKWGVVKKLYLNHPPKDACYPWLGVPEIFCSVADVLRSKGEISINPDRLLIIPDYLDYAPQPKEEVEQMLRAYGATEEEILHHTTILREIEYVDVLSEEGD